jgi:hypothetical protein
VAVNQRPPPLQLLPLPVPINQLISMNTDENDVIDLVDPRPPSPPLLPNAAIHIVLASTPFTEQGLFT